MTTYTLAQLAQCARREVGFRKHVYPNQVARHKMPQIKADTEIAMMEQIAAMLEQMAERNKPEPEFDIFKGGVVR